jgi:hypothetical protein
MESPRSRLESSIAARLPRLRFAAPLALGLVGAVSVGACGSRGPLDGEGPLSDGADAAVDARPEAGPGRDAAPEGGSILGCGTCLFSQCTSGLTQCVTDAGCRATFQCAVTSCLAGGSPSTACLLQCASGDPQGALKIFQILQCVTATCGGDCNPLLSGLLGGLGGLGGAGGAGAGGGGAGGGGAGGGTRDGGGAPLPPPPAGPPPPAAPAFVAAVSSHWPELFTPVAAPPLTSR